MSIIFMKYVELLIVSFSLLFLSIICQFIAGMYFAHLIKESEQMQTTENKLLKQCKLKYTSCYQLNGKVKNTAVFVDKFIQKIKCMGIPLPIFVHLSGQFMLCAVLLIGFIICKRLTAGDSFFQVIPYYFLSILYLYLFFSISEATNVSEKKGVLKTEIENYLENHLLPKLESEKEGVSRELVAREEKPSVTEKDQAELENLLRELLA